MDTATHLGLRSEFVIDHLESELIEEDEVIVLRSPLNQHYYFGNLLALKVPLDRYTPEQWQARFKQAFRDLPEVRHCTLQWLRSEPLPTNVKAFQQQGFRFEENHVLTLRRTDFTAPAKQNNDCHYRPLQSESDWAQWTALNIAEQFNEHREDELRPYLQGRIRNYRALEQQGYGETLGAFLGEQLIGYAGLYHWQNLARFQNVHVIEEHQNKAIARTLLTRLIERLPDTVSDLVIMADEHYHASDLYQSLGFAVTERECSLCWWPKKDA